MKNCSKCSVDKPLFDFFNRKDTVDKKQSWCKQCDKERSVSYLSNNKEKVKQRKSKYYQDNSDSIKQYVSKWRKDNKGLCSSYTSRRRAALLKATPSWSVEEDNIKAYNIAAYFTWASGGFVKFHVDHIIPLNHDKVCGLHVSNNLQILSSVKNLSKSNSFEVL